MMHRLKTSVEVFVFKICLVVDRPMDQQDHSFNPKLYVRSNWEPPRQLRNPDLEDKLFVLRQELLQSFSAQRPHWRNNLTRQERDRDVRILANSTRE